MLKIVPVISICLITAFFSESFSKKNPISSKYVYKEKYLWFFIAVVMAVFAGLRVKYNDTSAYTHIYNLIPENPVFSDIDLTFGNNPGFNILNAILKKCSVSTQGYIMFYSFFTYVIYIWFIHKYSTDFLMSVFLFICLVFTFPLAAIKQCFAVALCLLAVDKAVNKKWFSFIFWLFIAETFHAYSFMYLMVPFLSFIPWKNKKTWIMIVIFFFIGIMLKPLLGTVISITDSLGESYTVESFSEAGVNPFRLLVSLVPLVLSYMLKVEINNPESEVTDEEGLCMNLSFLNGEIMFVALFGTANYFARLANYFYIFPVIVLPRLFNMFPQKYKIVLKIGVILCYSAFFYYSSNVVYGRFDLLFDRMPLNEFRFFA